MTQQGFDNRRFIAQARRRAMRSGAPPVLFIRIELDDIVEEVAVFNPALMVAGTRGSKDARVVVRESLMRKIEVVAQQALSQRRPA